VRAQGAISLSPRGGWRLGWLSLEDTALSFRPPGPPGGRGSVRIGLASITRLGAEQRKFVLPAKRVLRLEYQPGQAARSRSCWVITALLRDWEAALSHRLCGAAEGGRSAAPAGTALAAALAGLGGTAALVLDYLAHRGYATTAELAALTGVDTEETVLTHLRTGFAAADAALGEPVIRYHGAFFDPRAGMVRHQSWRVNDEAARWWTAAHVPADVLVEDGEVVVVTSIPTHARTAPPSVRVAPDGTGVIVCDAGGHARWISVPEPVTGEPRCVISPTGTLVVHARR
jgi:hypothetical protein